MVYEGRIAGRKAPSYPADSHDAELVREAMARLRRRVRRDGIREQSLSLADLIGSAKGVYGTSDDVARDRDELRSEWP